MFHSYHCTILLSYPMASRILATPLPAMSYGSKPPIFPIINEFNPSRLQFRCPLLKTPMTPFSGAYVIKDTSSRASVAVIVAAAADTKNLEEEREGEGEGDGAGAAPVRIVAIVGDGSISPLKSTPWFDVMVHTSTRLKWVDESIEMVVFTDRKIGLLNNTDLLQEKLKFADILLIVAVTNPESVDWVNNNCNRVPNILCFESSVTRFKLGGSFVETNFETGIFVKLASSISLLNKQDESVEVVDTVSEAWGRRNSDDIRFCLLVIINAYIRPVSILKNLRAKGFSTLNCMIKNCGPQILNCLLDDNCRKALQCLNRCSPIDQVCNYRCIASYESPRLEEFSLCVLQKNNCLGLDAKIPEKPNVLPMVKFRGEDLSHEIAEDLFVGWLGKLEWSWRVVAGQNPAYDQFPCQYQLFYRGKAKGSFWYEPVFQVRTLEGGNLVWRRRKYRVKRGETPGTFHFSVLDNGVVSNEYWTIVDVCDDFSWGLFHYHGAARVAGQSYTGAVLVSPDGTYPDQDSTRLSSALDKCGIKEWELFNVDNLSCQNPPLGLPVGSRLHLKVNTEDKNPSSQGIILHPKN